MTETATAAPTPPARGKRLPRRLAALLGLFLLLLLAAPTLLSSGLGVGLIEWAAARAGAGELGLESVSLAWFGGQRAEGVTWRDAGGTSEASIAFVSTELSLAQALRGDLALETTRVEGLRATLELSTSSEKSGTGDSRPSLPTNLSFDARLEDADITLQVEGQEPLHLEGLGAQLALGAGESDATFRYSSTCRQGDLAGKIEGTGTLSELLDADGTLRLDRARAELELDATDVACPAIDQLLELDGLAAALLGDTLSLRVRATGNMAEGNLELTLDAPRLDFALRGEVRGSTFRLTEPLRIQRALDAPLAAWLASHGGVNASELGDATGLDLSLMRLSVPLDAAGLADLDAEGSVALGGIPSALLDRFAGGRGIVPELLGETVGLRATATSIADGVEVRIALESPSIEADEIVLHVGERVALLAPAGLRGTLTPTLFEALVPETGAPQLLAPASFHLRLGAFDAPLPDADSALSLAESASFSLGFDLDGVELQGLTGLDPGETLLGPNMSVHVSGTSISSLEAEAMVQILPGQARGVVDALFGSSPNLLHIQATGGVGPGGTLLPAEVRLALQTDNLVGSMVLGVNPATEHIGLLEPAEFEGTATQDLIERMGSGEYGELGLHGAVPLLLRIETLNSGLDPDDWHSTEAQVSLHFEQGVGGGAFGVLFGEKLALALSVEGRDIGPHVSLHVESDNLVLEAAASMDEQTLLCLDAPARLALKLEAGDLAAAGFVGPGMPVLSNRAQLTLSLDTLRWSPSGPGSLDIQAQGSLDVDRIELAESDARLESVVIGLSLDALEGTLAVAFEAQARASANATPTPIAIDAHLAGLFRDGALDPAGASLEAELRLDAFPTALLDGLAEQEGRLLTLLGPTVAVTGNARLAELASPRGALSMQLASTHLGAQLDANLDGVLTLAEPATIDLEVTPEAFAALMGSDAPQSAAARGGTPQPENGGAAPETATAMLELTEPFHLRGRVDALRLPLPAPGTDPASTAFDPAETRVVAYLSADPIGLRNPETQETLLLADLLVALEGESLASPLKFTTRAWLGAPDSHGPKTRPNLNLTARLEHPFDATGAFDLPALTLSATFEGSDLPVGSIDAWTGQEGVLVAALGPRMLLAAGGSLVNARGDLTFRAHSEHLDLRSGGSVANGVFRLAEPLTASLQLTEAVGQHLLADLHPYLRGISTEEPITLVVSDQGFVLPTIPFDLGAARIEQATLDLGRATIVGNRAVQGLLEMLHRREDGPVAAWFAPMTLSMADGQVTFTRRLELLLDGDIHLASWGSADLQAGTYQEILGLPDDTLRDSLGIRQARPGDMLRIPIEGSADKTRIDYQGGLANLARIQSEASALAELEKQLERANPLLRKLLEKKLKKAAKKLARAITGDKQTAPPPPAATPLPWEK